MSENCPKRDLCEGFLSRARCDSCKGYEKYQPNIAAFEQRVKELETGLIYADHMAKCARTVREIMASMMRRLVDMDVDAKELIDNLDVGNVDGFGVRIDEAIRNYDGYREALRGKEAENGN